MITRSKILKRLNSDRFFFAVMFSILLFFIVMIMTQPPPEYTPCNYRFPTTGQTLDCYATRTAQPGK